MLVHWIIINSICLLLKIGESSKTSGIIKCQFFLFVILPEVSDPCIALVTCLELLIIPTIMRFLNKQLGNQIPNC